MKNIIISLFFILLSTTSGMSQNTISFAYDTAGNRVSRTINLSSTKSGINGGDAEKLSFEKSEDFFTEILA
ncbi:hypothetical protein QUH73_20570, partial [Labilibaculum sp. K2S]|uniref:hypothetical protein n=1 Tax=Labilibaculum sp. K2S TaxID=3056386 RepID=UPI003FA60169|nr:hypothetical protein [Labilibaculum sp. K2S]